MSLSPCLVWDLFCRVIDNFGDVGVSWRLARDLAARGQRVRLWIDDAAPLRWMAPRGWPPGITVHDWPSSEAADEAGDVVIETFGCELPPAFVARMAARAKAPLWLNLEYLSAEAYVERSHGLSSPQFSGPGRGLGKRFFYPGFSPRTGGLLREPGLLKAQSQFDAGAWLAALGLQRRPGERIVSLFAYPNPRLADLLDTLAEQPTLLLVCPGAVQAELLQRELPAPLRLHALPFVSQDDFDALLWAADLNFVRGEDSFVRAQWAGKPFVWQIYRQDDGAHGPKLDAFLDLYLQDARAELATATRSCWRRWNELEAGHLRLPAAATAAETATTQALHWRAQLATQQDLCSRLLGLALKSS
ncbi:elongation factor P maturation arginine rhamnosyltransferase EarP [Paucibacter sp. DJ1R-11]|uniref:elongation factor P maturation arginine rhamnosyltransferase EarP n=1 Tax=Paucibacter sp. DJ1R-11 TaxID=2893556 RepID=UPI0021E39821|nr:elongation factor P maturation arginine rhamnosyltransferase EarP [Paucibacter sp. DJ1R-11]MCV2363990.1 elongation factor P maturation arginine rhamnosyltransferase EarP [Paucibacter sp. DJ1R-11]